MLLVEASGTAAMGIADEVARLVSGAVGWHISAGEARRWLERLATSDGPQLVIAIDGLGLEHDGIRRELEALSAQSMGPKVKFVIEADTSRATVAWIGRSVTCSKRAISWRTPSSVTAKSFCSIPSTGWPPRS